MRQVFCLALIFAGLAAQTPRQPDLTLLTRELRTAVENDSLASGSEIANRLDDAVQQRYKAWLIRDAGQRVDDVLSWLPADTESLWVNQAPFTIRSAESVQFLYQRPTQGYSLDRLAVLNAGAFYRALDTRMVQLVVAAARNIPSLGQSIAIPGPLTTQDVTYFYFFADPVDLPAPDESIEGRPVWHAMARIDSGERGQRGVELAQRDDENWIALARPDLLILANRHELLAEILQHIVAGSKRIALAADLPEWTHVDKSASFWGVRHYAAQSKPKQGERGFEAAELPRPDGSAQGVTVEFDSVKQQLQVRYLSGGELFRRRRGVDILDREFKVDHPEPGVWRLLSDVGTRGPWPLQFAMGMLGFGMYP
jgi:hypothetical protein